MSEKCPSQLFGFNEHSLTLDDPITINYAIEESKIQSSTTNQKVVTTEIDSTPTLCVMCKIKVNRDLLLDLHMGSGYTPDCMHPACLIKYLLEYKVVEKYRKILCQQCNFFIHPDVRKEHDMEKCVGFYENILAKELKTNEVWDCPIPVARWNESMTGLAQCISDKYIWFMKEQL